MLKTFLCDFGTLVQVLCFMPKHFNSLGKEATFLWLQTFPLETGHHGNRTPVSKIRTETMEPSQHSSPTCTSPPPQSLAPPPMCEHMYAQTHAHTQSLGLLCCSLFFLQCHGLFGCSDCSSHCRPLAQGNGPLSLEPILMRTWSEWAEALRRWG